MGNRETEAQRHQDRRGRGHQQVWPPGNPKLSFLHLVASSIVLPHLPLTFTVQSPPLPSLLLGSLTKGPTLQNDLLVSPPHTPLPPPHPPPPCH